jgi:hypothetical protein
MRAHGGREHASVNYYCLNTALRAPNVSRPYGPHMGDAGAHTACGGSRFLNRSFRSGPVLSTCYAFSTSGRIFTSISAAVLRIIKVSCKQRPCNLPLLLSIIMHSMGDCCGALLVSLEELGHSLQAPLRGGMGQFCHFSRHAHRRCR